MKEIEELKKAQAQEEEETEEAAEENEEVTEGEEQNEGEKLEGEPEEKKPKTSSSNASTLSIELKEKKSIRKVFILLQWVTWPSNTWVTWSRGDLWWPLNIVFQKNLKSDIPMPKIECNKIVLGQMEIVKPELINLGKFQSFLSDI